MEIWLVKKEDRLLLPITPHYNLDDKQNNTRENLNEIGTVNIAGKPGLREVKIDSFFPRQMYPFVASTEINTDPFHYYNKIKEWKDEGDPIQLIITDTPFNFDVLIDSFPIHEAEDDGSGSLHYSLSLSEYKWIGPEEVKKEKKDEITMPERLKIARSVPKQLMTTEEIDAYLDEQVKALGKSGKI